MNRKKQIIFVAVSVITALIIIFVAVLCYVYFSQPIENTDNQPIIQQEKMISSANWDIYKNNKYKYQIKYPIDAVINEIEKEGDYENNILESCVRISYKYGVIYFRANDSNIPCGPADAKDINIYESLNIEDAKYEASGYKQLISSYNNFSSEFLMVNLGDINIIYGIYSDEKMKESDYNDSKRVIKKIVESFKNLD